MKKRIENNKEIYLLLTILLLIRLFYLYKLGIKYNLDSDDLSYVNSGVTFLKTGTITMHGVLSAQIMPGMTFLIAFFSFLFGKSTFFWLMLKLFWIGMGLLSVLFFFKTVNLITKNKITSVISCFLFLSFDFAWMDNLILTETPFMLLTILLLYFSFKYAINRNNSDYYYIILYYILAIMFRPTIALFPIFLIIYLLLRGHDYKILFKKCLFAFLILGITLTPWIIRNYIHFNRFIPLTYGVGNPLLLGTYQGVGYPKEGDLNYKKEVFEKQSFEMQGYLKDEITVKPYMKKFYQLEYDKKVAEYRMKVWWKNNPKDMLKSYLYYKPRKMLYNSFYWIKLFKYDKLINFLFRKVELILFFLSTILIIFNKKYFKELLFLGFIYIYQIVTYSYTFAFDRYAQTLYFYRFIIVGIGFKIFISKILKIRYSKGAINDEG